MGEKWIEVRGRKIRRLLFRFNPLTDSIEVRIAGEIEIIALDDYRPPHQRRTVATETIDGAKSAC